MNSRTRGQRTFFVLGRVGEKRDARGSIGIENDLEEIGCRLKSDNMSFKVRTDSEKTFNIALPTN